MTYKGARPGWDEHATGTIRIEFDLELWSNSGRAKHVDVTEQGAWIADEVIRSVGQLMESMGDDVGVSAVRYYGEVTPSGDKPVIQSDLDLIGQQPIDK